MLEKDFLNIITEYHLPLCLRGMDGPDATISEMKAIMKMSTNLRDCLCILFFAIIVRAAAQPESQVGLKLGSRSESESLKKWGAVSQRRSGG